MKTRTEFFITLILRLILGILYLACGFAFLGLKFYLSKPDTIQTWLPNQQGELINEILSVGFIFIGALLLIGVKLRQASLASCGIIIVVLILHLISDPFYDTMKHLVPFYFISIVIYAVVFNRNETDLIKSMQTRDSCIALLLRLFIGLVFFAQGFKIVFVTGPIAFAGKVYVAGYEESILPETLLWIAGVINPFILLLGGFALFIGFRLKIAYVVVAGFLVSIVFGHMLQDPYETTADLTHYALNYLTITLAAWYYSSLGNFFSLDYLLSRNSKALF